MFLGAKVLRFIYPRNPSYVLYRIPYAWYILKMPRKTYTFIGKRVYLCAMILNIQQYESY